MFVNSPKVLLSVWTSVRNGATQLLRYCDGEGLGGNGILGEK